MKTRYIIIAAASLLVLSACGSKKAIIGEGNAEPTTEQTAEAQSALRFVQKVYDNAAYQKNIVADATLNINADGKNISLPAKLRMRRDDVIMIQVLAPVIHAEVARLEFAPDHVLIVDRLHKQYVRGSYADVPFLKMNGVDFFALQSIFWNQLYLPGQKRVGEDGLRKFSVDMSARGQQVPVSIADGKMTWQWNAQRSTGQIAKSIVTYNGRTSGRSTLTTVYSAFARFGSRFFPCGIDMTISTAATGRQKTLSLGIQLDAPTDNADWASRTTLSGRYAQVKAEDILGKLSSMKF